MHFGQLWVSAVSCASFNLKERCDSSEWKVLCELLSTMVHGRGNESQWIMAASHQLPARWRHAASKKSDETAAALVCCSFYFKAHRGITYSVPRARLTARSKFEQVSLTIWLPVLFSDLSCEVFPLVLSCRGVKAVLSQWRLYCNQLFSSGIQSLRSRQRNPRGSPQTQSGPLSTQL